MANIVFYVFRLVDGVVINMITDIIKSLIN